MAFGIAQHSHTLATPRTGRGRNIYLSERDFWLMIFAALVVHSMALIVYEVIPKERVIEVPVRAINLKIGGGATGLAVSMVPSFAEPEPVVENAQPDAMPPAALEAPTPPAKPVAIPPKPQLSKKTEPTAPKPAPKKAVKKVPEKPIKPANEQKASEKKVSISDALAQRPAVAQQPTQFVRQAPVAGSDAGSSLEGVSGPEMVRRYEQLLSQWLREHKVYPDIAKQQGLEGKAIIRLRIDRMGKIKFAALDRATGHALLDAAAMEMVKQANPVPAPPSNYPGANLLEFLIPVSYELQ